MTRSTTMLPRGALTRWLVDAGPDVPEPIRLSLFRSLYATPAIFFAGILNALLVSIAIAFRHPVPLFIGWAAAELILASIRLPVMIAGRQAVREGRRGPSDLYIFLNLVWTASIGFGGFISLLTGDWVAATLACVSAAAMVGGICFRNFAAPRLAVAMILLSLGPCTAAAFATGEPIMLVALVQLPLYMFAMSRAAFNMHRLQIARMKAELDKDHRARHDDLTGLYNRAGLSAALAHRDAAGGGDVAYFFLDLDGFKQVNDTLGHAAGDQLLAEVGERLRRATPQDSVLARLGGDEFLVVAACDRDGARQAAERIIDALTGNAYFVGGAGVEIGVSVGIASSQTFGPDFATLIEAADGALYQAKAKGQSSWAIASREPRLATSSDRVVPAPPRAPRAAVGRSRY